MQDYVVTSDGMVGPKSVVPLSYLLTSYPNIPWTSGLGVNDNNVLIEVQDELFFYALNNLLRTYSAEDFKLYVFTYTLVNRIWLYTPYGFRQQLQHVGYHGDVMYTELDCVEIALSLAREEIHSVFIGEYTKMVLDNRIKLTAIEGELSRVFQNMIFSTPWIQQDLVKDVTEKVKNLNLYFSPIKATLRHTPAITGAGQSFLSLCVELHKQNHLRETDKLGTNITLMDMDWTNTDVIYEASLNTLGITLSTVLFKLKYLLISNDKDSL